MRLSLSKRHLETGAGAELLSLCQTITEDGSLSEAELEQLRSWLAKNKASDIPAIGFLVSAVETIVRDGKITATERDELYRSLEKILPPEIREVVVMRRRIASAEKKQQEKAQRAAERAAAETRRAEERERDTPIEGANFMVAGTRYEGRDVIIRKYARAGDLVYLVRDKGNRYSRSAIGVHLMNGLQVGFVPEEDAVRLAPLLDGGAPYRATITKILTGARALIPVVDANLFNSGTQIQGLALPGNFSPAPHPKKGLRVWPAVLLVVAAVVAAFLLRWF